MLQTQIQTIVYGLKNTNEFSKTNGRSKTRPLSATNIPTEALFNGLQWTGQIFVRRHPKRNNWRTSKIRSVYTNEVQGT